MKRYLRRIGALLMATLMVLSMCLTVFANDNTSESTLRIKGIDAENGITVKAYKIIKYNTQGAYEEVYSGTIDKNDKGELTPTAANLADLSVRKDLGDGITITKKDGNDYIATADQGFEAGTYMIIVEGSKTTLYNPAIISVRMGTDGKLIYGELNFETDEWTGTGELYMKKSTPGITKTALTENVDGVQYGDYIQFQITSDVPDYTSTKEEIKYEITDTLTGLTIAVDKDHTVVATVGGAKDDTLTNAVNEAVVDNATSFTVKDLGDEFIHNHKKEQIVITYWAKVSTTAKKNVDETNNVASLEYSTTGGTTTKTSETKHYTFGIDTGVRYADTTVKVNKTGEFIKTDANGSVSYVKTGETTGEPVISDAKALAGAKFELHIGKETGPLFIDGEGKNEFVTDGTGRLEINGLDSDITYYLVETQAPSGYTVNNTAIPVKITAEYIRDENKKVSGCSGYKVIIGSGSNQAITYYKYNEEEETTVLLNDKDHPSNPYQFKNSELHSLPSTGGMGTYLFTITGVMIMAAVTGMFLVSRRKEHENQ